MLSLQLKSGEYLTIGDDIAIQIFQQSGSAFSVAVKAPKEIPVLRGAVAERSGEQRPDGLRDQRSKTPAEKKRDAKRLRLVEEKRIQAARLQTQKAAALQNMQQSLDHMEALAGQKKQTEIIAAEAVAAEKTDSSTADYAMSELQKEIQLLKMQLKRLAKLDGADSSAEGMLPKQPAAQEKNALLRRNDSGVREKTPDARENAVPVRTCGMAQESLTV